MLKREDILSMQPGRELDALVGKYVIQLDMVDDTLPQLPKFYLPEYDRTIFRDVPLYSSDISAAWEVVEKMKNPECEVYWFIDHWQAWFNKTEIVKGTTAPEAICKASLMVLIE